MIGPVHKSRYVPSLKALPRSVQEPVAPTRRKTVLSPRRCHRLHPRLGRRPQSSPRDDPASGLRGRRSQRPSNPSRSVPRRPRRRMRMVAMRCRCRVPGQSQLREDAPVRADVARDERREGRTRCRRPSGCVTVPSFSACVSSGKTTSEIAVVAFSKVEKVTMWSAAARADFQASVSGKSLSGSTPKSSERLDLAGHQAGADLLGAPAHGRLGQPRPGVGEAAGLAQAAGVGELRHFQQARRPPCRRTRARRRRRAGPRPHPAPDRSARPRRSRPCRRHAGPRRPPPDPPPNAPPALSVRRRTGSGRSGRGARRPAR